MELQVKRVLCTVDLSKATPTLIDFATSLSCRYEATLFIFHALYHAPDTFTGSDELERKRSLTEWANDARRQIESFMPEAPCRWQTMVVEGEPVEAAARVVREQQIDLAITRRQSFSALRKIFRWTLIERLARHLSTPLLILPPAGKSDAKMIRPHQVFERIVLACDLKTHGQQARQLVFGLARDFGTHLHLFHAMEAPMDERLVNPTEGPYWQVQEELQKKLRQKLFTLGTPLRHTSVELSAALRPGPAAESVCDYAGSVGATLVAVGARRHGKLGKLLIGSTTETLLRNAPCAVLVLPDDIQTT